MTSVEQRQLSRYFCHFAESAEAIYGKLLQEPFLGAKVGLTVLRTYRCFHTWIVLLCSETDILFYTILHI